MGGGIECVVWVEWVVFLRRWHTNEVGMLLSLFLLLIKYYSKERNVKCLLLKKKKKGKMFQIDLSIDLRIQ